MNFDFASGSRTEDKLNWLASIELDGLCYRSLSYSLNKIGIGYDSARSSISSEVDCAIKRLSYSIKGIRDYKIIRERL